jgi:hypothetical protein
MTTRARKPRNRDKAYLAALHELACIKCGSRQCVEAAHVRLSSADWEARTGFRTGAGGSEKPSDVWALPLCASCHRTGPRAEHVVGTVAFYRQWGVDPHCIAYSFYDAFQTKGPVAMRDVFIAVMFRDLGKITEAQHGAR